MSMGVILYVLVFVAVFRLSFVCHLTLCDWLCFLFLFFFFKQKTAYEMRISDWSSDVCSSDLGAKIESKHGRPSFLHTHARPRGRAQGDPRLGADRKSVVSGKSVSVRVDLGGRRIIKKNNIKDISMIRKIKSTDEYQSHRKTSYEYKTR